MLTLIAAATASGTPRRTIGRDASRKPAKSIRACLWASTIANAISARPASRAANPRAAGQAQPLFVVQKHAASRLHYDFRLEMDGVLKSWAVPKGPSLDPAVKALAVHVEDHPLDYADFEGIIPAGQYGGGTVMVWDIGTWEPVGDAAAGYRRGDLKFTLYGEKLQGEWVLVRMRGKSGDDKNWLLIKHRDRFARTKSDRDDDAASSVLSGRTMEEIAAAGDAVWNSNGGPSDGKSKRATPRRKPLRASVRSRPAADLAGPKSVRAPAKRLCLKQSLRNWQH